MGFLSESGVTALWNKVRANFGRTLSVSGPTITLKNGANTPSNLSQVTIPDATTSVAGVMSAADKLKLSGIEAGATKTTVDSELSSSSTNPVQNKVVNGAIGGLVPKESASTISVKSIDSSGNAHVDLKPGEAVIVAADSMDVATLTVGTETIDLSATNVTKWGVPIATTDDLADYATTEAMNAAIANTQVGAAKYKGAVSSNDAISSSEYKAGWYWVVASAGTYVGEKCEAGDMVFARTDKGGTYSANHFDVVQSNIIELTATEVEAICAV